jgi:glutamine amidotransferase
MRVAIIDYGSGNLRSAAKAVERAGRESGLDCTVAVTAQADVAAAADRLILPGVGAFADCMRGLTAVDGMVAALESAVIDAGRPFLGICVGMQLLASRGLEHGVHGGLGWIAGDVVPFRPPSPDIKIPHMGWNGLSIKQPHPLLAGISEGDHVYFLHSYRMEAADKDVIKADVNHGEPVAAVLAKDNIVGTQFHPEKSQKIGLRIIANFLNWRP